MIPYPSGRTVLRPTAVVGGEIGGFLADPATAGLTGRRFAAVVGLTGHWFPAAVVGLTRRRFGTARCGSEGSTTIACWESEGSRRGRGAGAPGGDVVGPLPVSLFATVLSTSGSTDAGGSATASLRDDGRRGQ